MLISIGKRSAFTRVPSDVEWRMLYKEAEKQALIGVCFEAIERLPKEQRPPIELLMTWYGMVECIRKRNIRVSECAAEVTHLFAAGGFRSVVLKGQGVALLYPKSDLRTPGDVDIWVDGERNEVIAFMSSNGWKVGRSVIHHTDVEIFSDVSVEVHHYPSYAYDPVRWCKYCKWFKKQSAKQMTFMDKSVGFAHPSIEFDVVYSLLHIYRHVFHEGIGLRQLLDYYYILSHTSTSVRSNSMKTLQWFGLGRFVAAVMYVERIIFELDEEYLLCQPDTVAGQHLLDEIMTTGNFGQYNKGIKVARMNGVVGLYIHNVRRLFEMVRFYPSEVLWAPIWKPLHFVWRKVKGY